MTIKKRKIAQGIRIKPNTSGANDSGDITIDSADEKLKVHLDSASRSVVTEDQTQTLENKTIDGTASGNNTVTIDATSAGYDNSTSGLAATDVQAAIDELDAAIEGKDEAIEIAYDNTASGLAATDVQAAIDEVEGRVDTAEGNISELEANQNDLITLSGVAENSTDLGTFTGTTISDNVTNKVALQELETSLELKANSDGATITNATIQNSSIETPTRLDMKQDTLANLETYAASASNGQLVFATDEKKTFQIVDNELIAVGGAQTVKLPAGEDLVLNDLVYISTGSGNDSGRTLGNLYNVDISNDDRIEVLGLVVSAGLTGEVVEVQFAGELQGLSGLSVGKAYFAGDTLGSISDTASTNNNVWSITVGLATSATSIIINPVSSASAVYIEDAEEEFTLDNNQSTPTNVTGLVIDPVATRSFSFDYQIRRLTDTAGSEVIEMGTFRAVYNSQAGIYLTSQDFAGNDTGVELTIQPSGQVQYTTTDISGPNYIGTLNYKIKTSFGA